MISVILSTNNEIRNNYLEKVLDSIKNQNIETEIIITDNWSNDWTIDICKKYTDKIFELKDSNRAQRLNYWFKKSFWDIILFNHPVSILPKNTFSKIEKTLEKNTWGAYSHSFDKNTFLYKLTSWYSNNIRAKRWIIYLDHCIFSKRKYLEKTDLFWNLDIFEDTYFSYNMRKFAKPIILKDKIITSNRRFEKRWFFKQSLINQYLKICFLLWKNHKTMNKIYEEKDGFNVKY